MSISFHHVPVLEETVLTLLEPKPNETVLDVTLGLAGHALRFLKATAPDGRFIGLDADTLNLNEATKRLADFSDRITLHHANFGELPRLQLPQVDILFADLGLSSPHVDDPSRGFTFRTEAPLDLRYDQQSGQSAADLIRYSEEEELAKIFRDYGELYPQARRLGKVLSGQLFVTTVDLRTAVEKAFGYRAKPLMPQVFQALRMAVNDELGVLQTLLAAGPQLLTVGGRMGVLSYHSLEDRMVKHAFRTLATPLKDDITGKVAVPASFELVTPKAVVASADESAANARARSVKFRILRRLA